jgi:Ubiquinol-cytochrome C chaperone
LATGSVVLLFLFRLASRSLDHLWPPPECALPPTFQTWFQVTLLHVYLLTVRFRALPVPLGRTYTQELINHVFIDAEERIRGPYNVHQGSLIKGYMRDMLHQYHGGVTALDQGIVSSDAVLAAAVWRNLFGAGWGAVGGVESTGRKRREGLSTARGQAQGPDEATLREAEFAIVLERIVVWMRKEIARLDGLPDDSVRLAKGEGTEHPAGFLPV